MNETVEERQRFRRGTRVRYTRANGEVVRGTVSSTRYGGYAVYILTGDGRIVAAPAGRVGVDS